MSYSNVSQITTYISYKLNILCKNLNRSYNARGQSAFQAAWYDAGYLQNVRGKTASLVNKFWGTLCSVPHQCNYRRGVTPAEADTGWCTQCPSWDRSPGPLKIST